METHGTNCTCPVCRDVRLEKLRGEVEELKQAIRTHRERSKGKPTYEMYRADQALWGILREGGN